MELVRAYLRAANAQESERFGEEIVRAVEPLLRSYLKARSPKESLEDLLQDILVEIITGVDSFNGRTDKEFRGWCFGIARHKLFDRYKEAKRTRACFVSEEDVASRLQISANDSREAKTLSAEWEDVQTVLQRLGSPVRELLEGRYLLGLDFKSLGQELGMKEDAARVATKRALARAQKLLEKR